MSASSLQKRHWNVILFHIGLHGVGWLGWGFSPSFFSLRAHPVDAASSWTWQWVAGVSLDRGGCNSASPQKPACCQPIRLSPPPSVRASQRQNSQPQGLRTNLWCLGPVYPKPDGGCVGIVLGDGGPLISLSRGATAVWCRHQGSATHLCTPSVTLAVQLGGTPGTLHFNPPIRYQDKDSCQTRCTPQS